ncbi:hypothetical protein DCAR_0521844 [Daucus carota subsp. sativus]|uniref:Exocyst complex component Sec8 n=1 Tax=Daucus carota subsp. sativus TaxID=79200 RepID=A0AAF0X780_DAUCS|nr:hypothetical protein DCAR_0521844 [Daucus carota subsp. sativus]
MGIFDDLPVPKDHAHLREELARIDESWATSCFDSLPHVVHILTSKDREGEVGKLKEQSDIIEKVVDAVVHNYHSGFNKAIQNYSQILRLFSESTQKIGVLKVDLADAKKFIGSRNKQLNQLSYRSVTLRHIISLLDQIEDISKVPNRIEKLVQEKQFYAAVQLHVQSTLMLEREGLQMVGALQDVRSELTKMRGIIFYKVLEDMHAHLYNKGELSSAAASLHDTDDAVPTTTAASFSINNLQPLSRRTRSHKGDNQLGAYGLVDGPYVPSSVDGGSSYDGHEEDGGFDGHGETASNGYTASGRVNGGDNSKDAKTISRQIPIWLSASTPDEFVELLRKSDAPVHVKYLQTMVECLCMLGKVAAAGAIICQRLRPTLHEIISTKIKAYAERVISSRPGMNQAARDSSTAKGQLQSYQLSKQKRQNGTSMPGTLLAVSPVSPVMAPMGTAQATAKELLDSIFDTVVRIFENHVIVGNLLESKSSQIGLNTPKSMPVDITWNPDSEARDTGGYSIGFSLTVLQSECQQLICEILRATPDAASADTSAQTARLAKKTSSKSKVGSEDGLTFAFRFTDVSVPNQGDLIRQNWKKGPNVQEGYGSAAVLPEQGIYLAASVYRPVLQFSDKISSILPQKYSQLGNDGLLAFLENFVKEHFLPTLFVDYRKSVQQAISSPAAFRPRAHTAATYTPSIEKGRPVLQGLLAIEFLAKEVFGWAQAMPKFAGDLINNVQAFLERSYERCRTSYMEAVLEKQSYMLIGRHDIENLMRRDPASSCLPNSCGQTQVDTDASAAEISEFETEMSDLLLNLRPIKQENLIRDDNKLILLASLSDSLEYVADSIERLGKASSRTYNNREENGTTQSHHTRTRSTPPKDLVSFADEYRKLAIDCLKVLRVEMQLETIFHMQIMSSREYSEDEDAEEPDDFVIALVSQITRRDEEMAPFLAGPKRSYILGGICSVAANAAIKGLAEIKSINLFGVQQICRNSIALEQALSAIPSTNSEAVQLRLDRVRTYFELLNMPFEALLAFIMEHVSVPGRDIPADAQARVNEILSR